ncbi:MAG: glycine cleavage system protein GcvH [Planctomycetes bacterium]|nr:glycine cleavage system protein GcvH [Planctomycetota bacterium]
MPNPKECRFAETHEWLSIDEDVVTLGLTKYAVNELTDITYIEMKEPKSTVLPGESVGEVESVKTTSDVYSPIGGELLEVNDAVVADPSLLNSDPYGAGWLVRIRTTDPSPLDALMDRETYEIKYPE